MRVTCPDCSEHITFDSNEYEEDDFLECPECSTNLILKVQRGQFKVITEKEKYYSSELDELYEEE